MVVGTWLSMLPEPCPLFSVHQAPGHPWPTNKAVIMEQGWPCPPAPAFQFHEVPHACVPASTSSPASCA